MPRIDKEHCYVCGKSIPYSEQPNGASHPAGIRYCLSEVCAYVVRSSEKDYQKSHRGRKRRHNEILREIDKHRSASVSRK